MNESAPPLIEGLTYVRKLGSGGFADVFLYDEANPERQVAVKVMRDTGLSPQTARRFTAEANAMARLEHTYIVPVYSTGITRDGRPYIKMRYYPRSSLAERARRERFSVPETLRLGIQLGSAIETAHRAGLLHRDIKPANVLTNANGKPGLTDFGIAAQIADDDDPETGVSVPWSPPETLYGTAAASVRSDVYSLAATLWHLLVGRSPFEVPGGDNAAFAMMRRVRDIPPPSTGRADVPPSLDRLLRAALSKDPALRPSSAREFIGALQAIEQELRLPRTESELVEEHLGHTLATPPPIGDATVVSAPRLISPERPAATPTLSEEATRLRGAVAPIVTGYQDGVDGGTVVRRLARRADAEDSQPEDRGSEGRRRLALTSLAVVLLIAAVAIGFVLTNRQVASQPTITTPSVSVAAPDLQDHVPPGTVQLFATRAAGKVSFTWRYTSALPDDQVEWRVKGTTNNRLAGPNDSAVVAAPATGDACIEVRVSRFDGSYSQGNQWTSKCG